MSEARRGRGRPALADDVARLNLSLPAALLQLVEERARRDGMTRAEWVRYALMVTLGR